MTGERTDFIATLLRDRPEPGRRLLLSGAVRAVDTAPGKFPALVVITFRDAQGEVLADPVPGLAISSLFGHFHYIGAAGQTGRIGFVIGLEPPPATASVEVGLRLWHAQAVTVATAMGLVPEPRPEPPPPPAAPPEVPDERLMAELRCDVVPGDSYDLLARFADGSELAPRFALVNVQFSDASGQALAAGVTVPVSSVAGAYRYLMPVTVPDPADPRPAAVASFIAPAGAAHMVLRLLRWQAAETLILDTADILWLGEPAVLAAQGHADLPQGDTGWLILRGEVEIAADPGPETGLVELSFTDAAGQPMDINAEGLRDTDRFRNVSVLERGVAPVLSAGVLFRSPPGAVRLRWRLRAAPGTGLTAGEDWSLAPIDLAPVARIAVLPAAACLSLVPDAGLLRAALPVAPPWPALAQGSLHLLAEVIAPAEPGAWLRVTADLPRGGADLLLHPVWFDAAGAVLAPETVAGCDIAGVAGLVRQVTARQTASGAILSEAFLSPPAAAFAAFYLLGPRGGSPPLVSRLAAGPVQPAHLLEGFDPVPAEPAVLTQAAAIAAAAGDLRSLQVVSAALAASRPQDMALARRARDLAWQLDVLDPGWQPPLARLTDFSPDPAHVLSLCRAGGTAPVAQLAAAGLQPVALLPLNAHAAPDGLPARDGVHLLRLADMVLAVPQYPGLVAAQIAPADLLTLEAALAGGVLRRQRAGLIHAVLDAEGCDRALLALALARAGDLPFLCEWYPGPEDSAADLAPLRAAQRARCLTAADAVIVRAPELPDLTGMPDLATERLFLLPATGVPVTAVAAAVAHHAPRRVAKESAL